MSIEPRNLTAQLHHRATGNPPSTLPESAISNCFPGLEFDFRNVWRRILEGIELHEASGLVVRGEGELSRLTGRLLLEVGGEQTWRPVFGPGVPETAFTWLEWSNALAGVLAASSGQPVDCVFLDVDDQSTETVALRVRPLFVRSAETGDVVPLVDEAVAEPGELTQSLCSPWQNDYRECGCYYWAASRPDYVNVETTAQGPSVGNNWLARSRVPKRYDVPDEQQVSYDELFRDWQGLLRFIVEGRDRE